MTAETVLMRMVDFFILSQTYLYFFVARESLQGDVKGFFYKCQSGLYNYRM